MDCIALHIMYALLLLTDDLSRYRDWLEPGEAQPIKEPDREPYCFPVFRWSLILLGLGMLVCVLIVLVQLLVDWGRGTA